MTSEYITVYVPCDRVTKQVSSVGYQDIEDASKNIKLNQYLQEIKVKVNSNERKSR